ncbi:MAG: nucleoside triphosphate pyrophosphatase [Steroidobacteraceae bacterium]
MIADELLSPAAPRLILASTSPHRRALLARLGLPFECQAPGVEEAALPGEKPAQRALRLAHSKAAAVAHRQPGNFVIGSDQVASLAHAGWSEWLDKPGDRATCEAQLAAMSGREVSFHTGVVLLAPGGRSEHVDHTVVRLRALTAAEIAAYIDREPAFDCAGGFKCEGLGVTLFDAVATQDPTALIGLPLIWLCQALRVAGVEV